MDPVSLALTVGPMIQSVIGLIAKTNKCQARLNRLKKKLARAESDVQRLLKDETFLNSEAAEECLFDLRALVEDIERFLRRKFVGKKGWIHALFLTISTRDHQDQLDIFLDDLSDVYGRLSAMRPTWATEEKMRKERIEDMKDSLEARQDDYIEIMHGLETPEVQELFSKKGISPQQALGKYQEMLRKTQITRRDLDKGGSVSPPPSLAQVGSFHEIQSDECVPPLLELFKQQQEEGQHLGIGATCIVHSATYQNTPVAVKMLISIRDWNTLKEEWRVHEHFLKRYKTKHPQNVVQAFGPFLEPDVCACIVMERAESNLRKWLQQERTLSRETRWDMASDIQKGISCLHDIGIVHRDIKPENILVFPKDGRVECKIADFGCAFFGKTEDQQIIGTHGYRPPESYKTPARQDMKGDVYAYGVVLYEIATGKIPYDKMTDKQIAKFVGAGQTLGLGGIDHQFAKLIQHCWDKNPERRPSFEQNPKNGEKKITQLLGELKLADATIHLRVLWSNGSESKTTIVAVRPDETMAGVSQRIAQLLKIRKQFHLQSHERRLLAAQTVAQLGLKDADELQVVFPRALATAAASRAAAETGTREEVMASRRAAAQTRRAVMFLQDSNDNDRSSLDDDDDKDDVSFISSLDDDDDKDDISLASWLEDDDDDEDDLKSEMDEILTPFFQQSVHQPQRRSLMQRRSAAPQRALQPSADSQVQSRVPLGPRRPSFNSGQRLSHEESLKLRALLKEIEEVNRGLPLGMKRFLVQRREVAVSFSLLTGGVRVIHEDVYKRMKYDAQHNACKCHRCSSTSSTTSKTFKSISHRHTLHAVPVNTVTPPWGSRYCNVCRRTLGMEEMTFRCDTSGCDWDLCTPCKMREEASGEQTEDEFDHPFIRRNLGPRKASCTQQ